MSKKQYTRSGRRIQAIPLNEPTQFVVHLDYCTFGIHVNTDSDLLRLGFPDLIEAIRRAFGWYVEPPDWETSFKMRPKGFRKAKFWQWLYRLESPFAVMHIYGTGVHLGKRLKKLTCSAPPEDLIARLFPSKSEILALNYHWNLVGEIRFSNPSELDYAEYQDSIMTSINGLERHRVALIAKKIELAFDTVDPLDGPRYQKALLPPYYRPKALFYCCGRGSHNKIKGPSTNGLDEYVYYRPKGRRDHRPASERPRGGRRQFHVYDRTIRITIEGHKLKATLHRIEVLLYRDCLREIMQKK